MRRGRCPYTHSLVCPRRDKGHTRNYSSRAMGLLWCLCRDFRCDFIGLDKPRLPSMGFWRCVRATNVAGHRPAVALQFRGPRKEFWSDRRPLWIQWWRVLSRSQVEKLPGTDVGERDGHGVLWSRHHAVLHWALYLRLAYHTIVFQPLSPIDKCPRNHFFVAWNFVAVAPSGGEVTFISSTVLGEPTVWTLREFRGNAPETQPWGVIIEAALDEHDTRSGPRNTNGLRSVTVNLTSQTYAAFNYRLSNNAQSYFRYPK